MMSGARRIVCVGVGGMGMAPLALYLRESGACVWGYDDALLPRSEKLLRQAGVQLIESLEFPEDCTEVIISSAISDAHPLFIQAKERGIPVFLRGEYLARLLEDKKVLAVVGSHGKTTTTALLIAALRSAGVSFSYVLGGFFRADNWVPASCDLSSQWVVVEVDESDGTMEYFTPHVTVAVNFDWDHIAHYPTQQSLERAFAGLFKKTKDAILIPSRDALLEQLASDSDAQLFTFGEGGNFDGVIESLGFNKSSLRLTNPQELPALNIPAGGSYNGVNALAALGALSLMGKALNGVSFEAYPGVARRQDILWDRGGLSVLADYAHHPSELKAVLASLDAKSKSPLTVVFQPHRYTRTAHLASAFAEVLSVADHVHLMPVYAASEEPMDSGKSEAIADVWPTQGGCVSLWEDEKLDALQDVLLSQASGTIAFLGAGDIEAFAQAYREALVARTFAASLGDGSYFSENEPLAKKTTLRVGGSARYYAEPASEGDLVHLLKTAHSLSVPVFMLGRGSNVIIADEGFSGLVVRLNHPSWREVKKLPSGAIQAGAGARLKEICGFACKQGAGGFEFLEGIPASLGGALRMNAGAMGGWMFDVVESVTWVTPEGELKHWDKEAFSVGYRQCKELLDGVALSAVLKPVSSQAAEIIYDTMQAYATSRKATQPREPSAGCIFKNAKESPAGKLVDELGLKGLCRGKAEVSLTHGNFIINKGNATSRDVLGLVKEVHDRVHEATGINLEPEVLLLGKSWREVLS